MGWPPDPSKVPESFWAEVEEETRQEQFLALYLMFIGSAGFHLDFSDDVDDAAQDKIEAAGNRFAETEAARAAGQWATRMRGRFERMGQRIDALRKEDGGTTLTKQEFEDELGSVIDSDDAAQTAATEATAAQTAGGDAAAGETFGVSGDDLWINQPHLTRTGPCERCEALHKKKRSEWSTIEADAEDGPPLHDYCACVIQYQAAGVLA